MSENKKEILAVCPACNGIVFRKGELEIQANIKSPSLLNFLTKCPHCGREIKVKFEIKTKTEQVF